MHIKIPIIKKALSNEELLNFTQQFGLLISAKLSIIEALNIVNSSSKSKVIRNNINNLTKELKKGISLSAGLKKSFQNIPNFYLQLIVIGEKTGRLEHCLNLAIQHLNMLIKQKNIFFSAIYYPIFILTLSIMTLVYLTNNFIPIVEQLLLQVNVQLPLVTYALFKISFYFRNNFTLIFTLNLITFYLLYNYIFTKEAIYYYLYKNSKIYRKYIELSLISKISIGYEAGIPLLELFSILAQQQENHIVKKNLNNLYENLLKGNNIYQSIVESRLFSKNTEYLIKLGEISGTLDKTLSQSQVMLTSALENKINKINKLLAPALLLGLGLVIGTIIIAIYLPIFELYKAI